MPEGAALDLQGAGSFLLSPRESHRSTVLYSLESADVEPSLRKGVQQGVPVAVLFEGAEKDLYRRWHQIGQHQLPRVRHSRAWQADDLDLVSAESEVRVSAAHTWLFEMPNGGLVAGLTLDYKHLDPSNGFQSSPALFGALDAGRYEIRVGGEPLLDVCLEDVRKDPRIATWGADIHHLMFAAPGSLPPSEHMDLELAQRLVSRRDAPSREAFLTVRLPREPNRYPEFLCAVSPGGSALAGHPAEVELAVTISAVHAIAAVSALRESQRRAYAALAEFQMTSGGLSRTKLASKRENLAELELDMSFAVEAYLDLRLLVPSMPIVQFHHELVDALGLPRSAEVTSKMLARLSAAIAAESDELADLEREADERRWRTWSAVGGMVAGVAVPLSLILGFLGIAASEVDSHASFADLDRYGAYYAAIIGLVLLAALAGRMYLTLHYRAKSTTTPASRSP